MFQLLKMQSRGELRRIMNWRALLEIFQPISGHLNHVSQDHYKGWADNGHSFCVLHLNPQNHETQWMVHTLWNEVSGFRKLVTVLTLSPKWAFTQGGPDVLRPWTPASSHLLELILIHRTMTLCLPWATQSWLSYIRVLSSYLVNLLSHTRIVYLLRHRNNLPLKQPPTP